MTVKPEHIISPPSGITGRAPGIGLLPFNHLACILTAIFTLSLSIRDSECAMAAPTSLRVSPE